MEKHKFHAADCSLFIVLVACHLTVGGGGGQTSKAKPGAVASHPDLPPRREGGHGSSSTGSEFRKGEGEYLKARKCRYKVVE